MTVTALPHSTGHPGYTETLPCEARSAKRARRLVRTALAAWALDHLAEPGELVVTELVANASQHTRCRYIHVTVTRPSDDLVRIGVVDKSHTVPEPRNPDHHEVRGRGLALIAALTHRWGTDLLPWGKKVWGELHSGAVH
ncbi:ATP-binding protein [Streptomyces sp. NPDC091279]|uniref:ATP-binding protein n=1 Tax=unclassified Streptomyces TaxID=2593676 RepID=UPI003816AD67